VAVDDGSTQLWILQAGDTAFPGDSFSNPAGDEAHRTFFFTWPGGYQAGFQAAGINEVTQVSGQAVSIFQIVPEPSGMGLVVAIAAAGRIGRCLSLGRRFRARTA